MEYRLPTMEDEELLQDYVAEHRMYGEPSISAGMGLTRLPFPEWLESIVRTAEDGNEEYGHALLYLCLEEGRLVGLLSVRYELSDALTEEIGNIGYGVRPMERRKGYAARILKHGLKVCREKGMHRVVLGCFSSNEASAATIRRCGGRLYAEQDSFVPGRLSCYYEILL